MKRLVVVSILLLLAVGCGHSKVWYSPSKTLEQTRVDVEECKRRAEQPKEPARITSRPGYPSDQGAQLRHKLNDTEECLKAKGYWLVEKSSLDSQGKEYYDASPF